MRRFFLALTVTCLIAPLLLASAAWGADGKPSGRQAALDNLRQASAVTPSIRLDTTVGTVEWLTGRFSQAAPGQPVESSFRFLERFGAAFAVDSPRDNFSLLASLEDDQLSGWRDVYLTQRIHGIPVLGSQLVFHYNGARRLTAVTGHYVPSDQPITTPKLVAGQAVGKAVDAAAALPAADSQATDLAAATVAGQAGALTLAEQPRTRLVYFMDRAGNPRLSYEVTVVGTGPAQAWTLVVDARSGAVLSRVSDVQTAGHGIDLRGRRVSLNTTKASGRWKLIDRSQYMRRHHSNHPHTTWDGAIEIRDAKHIVDAYGEGVSKANYPVVKDPNNDNFFNYGGSDAKKNQRSAVSLARNLATTYKQLRARVGRNSLDGKGISVIGNVHLGKKYENAYWDGQKKMMFFGDNASGQPPFAKALDVVAHEFGHGVTQYSVPGGGLVYMDPSGALNESYSDLWGTMVDYQDWQMGEDLGVALRNLETPSLGDPPLPASMLEYNLMALPLDGGGNHYNAGIGGHLFQQLSSHLPATPPAADGRFTAAKIAGRAYRYLGNYASMRDWAFALRYAAIDLYGAGSAEETAVVADINALGLSTIDFDQWDDGWCLDSSNALRETMFGKAIGWEYLAVQFTKPAGALLYRIYVALDAAALPPGNFYLYVISPDTVNGGPLWNGVLDAEILGPSSAAQTGQFTAVQITDVSGNAVTLDPGDTFYLAIGYVEDTWSVPYLLLDSGDSPQDRSWTLEYDEAYPGNDPRAWSTHLFRTETGDTGNFMIRPMYYYPSGVAASSVGAKAAGASAVRVIDGPMPGKPNTLATTAD